MSHMNLSLHNPVPLNFTKTNRTTDGIFNHHDNAYQDKYLYKVLCPIAHW